MKDNSIAFITNAQTDAADLERIRKYDTHISEARLQSCICEHRVCALKLQGTVIGMYRYSLFWESIPFLDLLYVDAAQRGRGYGTRLMAHWEAAMKNMGYPYVMLSTQENETARFFYEKLGYRRIGAFLPPEQAWEEWIYGKELSDKK